MKQIYPATITGKSFAPGGSVLDHKFGQGDPYTLGVEEEYMLLDEETYDLVQHIDTVLAAVSGHELEDRINPELMQSVLEIATPICKTPADVDQELLIDLLVGPIWTRLLITHDPITPTLINEIVDAVGRAFPAPQGSAKA